MATLDEMRRSLIAAHNSGDTITARKLALSIKLMESQPMGAVPVAQPLGYRSQAVRRPLTMGERVQEFGAGVGRGLETQLGGIRAIGERFSQLQQESAEQPGSPLQAMVFRPAAQLGREFLAGIEPYVRDPGKIVEAGQEMASRAASGPQQAGQVFGEMVDPRGLMAALKTPPVAEMTTYHGTPHVFSAEEDAPLGRFRASEIGSGRGRQMYGHGLYIAEDPVEAGKYKREGGSLYTVDLPDPMVERMLDWDNPLSEQSEAVQEAIEKLKPTMSPAWQKALNKKTTGQSLYTAIASATNRQSDASIALKEMGIPGIRYLDAGSRYLDAGSRNYAKRTRNFVIFPGEEQNLTILQRD